MKEHDSTEQGRDGLSVAVEVPERKPADLSLAPDTVEGWNALYIDGKWVPAGDRDTYPMTDPASEEQIGKTPIGTEGDVEAAYEAAEHAHEEWAQRTPDERATVIADAWQVLDSYRDELMHLFIIECGGVPLKGGFELDLVEKTMRTSQGLAMQMAGKHKSSLVQHKETQVRRNPVGVVGAITPWNFPFHLSMRVVAPALATGNAVVLKPAEDTPLLGGLVIAKAFEEAGLPDGLLNVVTGTGLPTGEAVATSSTPRVISFTGSSEVGREVGKQAVENFAYPSLELGGNNAHIVTENADLDWAIDAGVFGSFTHQGQECISINRHIVHESHYDEYVERLAERAEQLPVGDPKAEDTVVGPVINGQQRNQIVSFIEETVEQGATIEAGGSYDGQFVEPTVISGVDNSMPTACNEHFGPVAPVVSVSSTQEAIEIANETEYGLSGSVHSQDLSEAKRIAEQLETGMVHINDQPLNDHAHTAFGGTGASGIGRFNGEAVLEALTETKWISIQREPRDYPY